VEDQVLPVAASPAAAEEAVVLELMFGFVVL
jgi:hypothetical protein